MKQSKITVYGTPWCADCHRSMYLLDKQGVKYHYINIEENPQAAKKVREINHGMQSTPTIIFPNGKILVEPSNEELINAIKGGEKNE